MPSRKEIVPNSLRLPYFAACPAELRVRRGGFFLFSSRKDAEPQRSLLFLASCRPDAGRLLDTCYSDLA